MELHKLEVLEGQTGTCDHGIAVTRARVGARAAKVRAAISTRCEYGLVGAEAVEGAVLHADRNDTDTLAILHDEVERKIFNEEVGVVAQ